MNHDLDPYDVLGVASHATPAEINRAFRAKLRGLHPDSSHAGTGSTTGTTQLEQLIAAYHLLRDPEDRAQHDRNAAAATAPSHRVAANSAGPLPIPVTQHRGRGPGYPLWAGPVRRHR